MPESRHIFPDYNTLSLEAAKYVFSKIESALGQEEKFVLGMATGNSPIKMYEELVTLLRGSSNLNFANFYTVNLDEYFPLQQANDQSYHFYMRKHFWEPLQEISNTFDYTKQGLIPNGEAQDSTVECASYEKKIKEFGGIDLQILGIGTNGHIGFNEPGSPSYSRTRVVKLADATIKDNSANFGGDINAVPKEAITMGIATILEAKEIVVLASGASKTPILKTLSEMNEPSQDVPASYLMNHPSVQFFIDSAANQK